MGNGWGGARPGAGRPIERKKPVRADARPKRKPERAAPTTPRPLSPLDMMNVIAASHERRRPRRHTPELNPFQLPWFPPSAIPADESHAMAMDDGITAANQWWASSMLDDAAAEGLVFLGYPFLSELAQRTEYRVASETIATEMTRRWIKFKGTGDSEDKSGKIKELVDFLDDLQVRDKYEQIAKLDGWFGRSHLYHDFGDSDQENAAPIGNGRDEVTKAKAKEGRLKLKRLQVIEPTWCYPTTYNATNPLSPDWYTPQVWYVMGQQIHRTRCLTFIGREVPDMLKPAYAFGGLALSQILKPYVDIWLKTRESIGELIHACSVMVLMADLQQLVMPNDAGGLITRANMFNALRDNQGLFVINKNTEDFKNVRVPLSDMDKLQAQAQEHMMSASRIPSVKFTGIQPTGLNATADGELRAFNDTIHAYQNKLFRPNLQRTVDFAMITLWGKRDPDITFEFESLWDMTDKEKSEIRKIDAETGQILVDSNAIRPEEERKRVAEDPETLYVGLDVDDVPEVEEPDEGLDPEDAQGAAAAFGLSPQDKDR